MIYSNFSTHLLSISKTGVWVPSHELLVSLLVIGALLISGVALSALTFYEDFYWGDKEFREKLRFHPSRREFSSGKKSQSLNKKYSA